MKVDKEDIHKAVDRERSGRKEKKDVKKDAKRDKSRSSGKKGR